MEWLLAVTSAGLVAGVLVVAELAARTTGIADDGTLGDARLHRYSETYGWTPEPGARLVVDDHLATINEKGYRGRVVEGPVPEGAKRVVMLGDSVTFGIDVADGETFSSLLDSWENGLEVVNLGVQGYGFDQELLKLEREGLSCSPDVVVLNVSLENDFADIAGPTFLYDSRHPKPYFRVEAGRLVLHADHLRRSRVARAADSLRRNSHLIAWITSRRDRTAPIALDEHWAVRRRRARVDGAAHEDLAFRLIGRMRDAAARAGADFVVVLHPNRTSFRHGSRRIDALRTSPALQGVAIIDMRLEYAARKVPWKRIALDDMGHLSREGHRTAAEILQDLLPGNK